jgi:hypothetical protein
MSVYSSIPYLAGVIVYIGGKICDRISFKKHSKIFRNIDKNLLERKLAANILMALPELKDQTQFYTFLNYTDKKIMIFEKNKGRNIRIPTTNKQEETLYKIIMSTYEKSIPKKSAYYVLYSSRYTPILTSQMTSHELFSILNAK